jgi:PucR family transcriptional regulator, purine catabolism regulatory protein
MYSITVKKLIEDSPLKGLRLLTGNSSDNNFIYNVNIIDNPDSYDWFSAGDFLLTTGFVFKDNVEAQKRLIKELSDLNCAGLGVKIKRYWNEVPKVMIEEAKKRNLPIVEIPFNYSLAQVSNIINDEIFKRQDSLLKKYKNIHDVFSQCSLSGGELSEIVKLAAELVGNPVIMLDSNFSLLAFADSPNNPHPLKNYLTLRIRERVFTKVFTNDIPTDVTKFTVSIKRKLDTGDGEITCRIIPIVYSNFIYGYIVVWETIRKLQAIDYIALESAATAAALERIKTRQMEENKNRIRDDFFDDLLQGKIASVNAVKSLAKIHGMDPLKKHVVAALYLDNLKPDKIKNCTEIINEIASEKHRHITTINRQNHILMFVQLSDQENKFSPEQKLRDFFEAILTALEFEFKDISFKIGVSNINSDFLNIGKSSFLAIDMIKISNRFKDEKKVYYYTDLIGYHLIDSAVDKDQRQEFFEGTLGLLHHHDYSYHTDLMATLEAYFKANGNVSEAAKNLFIHRNTFIYRLEKIKEILKTDFSDAEQNFNYQLALKIYRILQP